MNFLTAAIPGLREIRAPLVAGYMWLIFAWLVVDPQLPLTKHSTGVVHTLAVLGATAGKVATAAAVSIAAYLIGAISTQVTDWLEQRMARSETWAEKDLRARSKDPLLPTPGQPLSHPEPRVEQWRRRATRWYLIHLSSRPLRFAGVGYRTTVIEDLRSALSRLSISLAPTLRDSLSTDRALVPANAADTASRLGMLLPRLRGSNQPRVRFESLARPEPTDTWETLRQKVDIQLRALQAVDQYDVELLLPATLIVGGSPLAFSETDRLKSEGQFRLAVSLPLVPLICLFAFQGIGANLLWVLALAAPLVLGMQGVTSLRESQKMIRDTIEHGDATSPAMEEFEAYLTALDKRDNDDNGIEGHEVDQPGALKDG